MEDINLINKVKEKLDRELNSYKDKLKDEDVDTIISKSYETSIKNRFPDMFYDDCDYSEYELRALLEFDNTLDVLYQDWKNADSGLYSMLQEQIDDYICELGQDYIKKSNKKQRNNNFER